MGETAETLSKVNMDNKFCENKIALISCDKREVYSEVV